MYHLQELRRRHDQPLATDERVSLFLLVLVNRDAYQFISDLLSLDISDDSDEEDDEDDGRGGAAAVETVPLDPAARREMRRAKLKKRGIELKTCKHVFCGVSLLFTISLKFPSVMGVRLKKKGVSSSIHLPEPQSPIRPTRLRNQVNSYRSGASRWKTGVSHGLSSESSPTTSTTSLNSPFLVDRTAK